MKKKIEEEVLEPVMEEKVSPHTEMFGNGDLNTLKDKLNEVIQVINKL